MNIEVLHEDEALVVINKPAGLIVHSDGRTQEASVVDWLKSHVPHMLYIGEPQEEGGDSMDRRGVVHRLDRDTSGVLILAKTQEMYLHLKKQFLERSVQKVYRAFVYGSVTEERGVIDRPIARSKTDHRRWTAQKGRSGLERDAVTYYKTLIQTRNASYLELRPQTGRTHQIRVHLKAIHHPVICDSLYANGKEALLGFSRLALHAHTVKIEGLKGETFLFTAPLPHDFITAEKMIQDW